MGSTVPMSVWDNVKKYFKERLHDRYDLQDIISYSHPGDSYLYMVIAKEKDYPETNVQLGCGPYNCKGDVSMYIVPKIEVREAEDIADFATTMDSDMNQYFEEKKTLLEDIPRGENPGTAYYSFYPAVINPKLFYAYILAIKYFQDGTCRWKLCLTSRENEECHMTLGIMRGTEEEAKKRLATILTSGSIR